MSLKELLIQRIEATGPLTIAEYMAECLLHPRFGYYATRDPFGVSGDFTTAPEISQMFGEMLGLCLAQTWIDQGRPTPFILAEIGPGRGTLMRDMLRATARVPGFTPDVHLIEASASLRKIQADTLQSQATWHDDISTLPDAPLYLVGNEFFDALPIRQFQRMGAGWQERCVGTTDGSLHIGLKPATPDLNHRLADTEDGDIVEICPALPAIVEFASDQIETHGGAAIFIDYGDWRSKGDTLQALQNHTFTNPLQDPGNADLTAHVDFEPIANAAANVTRMTPQGVLLERLGITQRAQALAQNLSGDALQSHIAAHRRLTHPDEMGTLFKTIALYTKGAQPPPGFD